MKRIVRLFGCLLLAASFGGAEQVSSITQYGITWTFDKAYEAGQFVTGDWWVVGPVTVTDISKPSDMAERDGSMINPMPSTSHGYDGRVGGYDSLLDVSTRIPTLMLDVDVSLVSTIARVPEELDRALRRPALEVGAILTVLGEAPPANSFRPAYAGTTKVIHSADNLRSDLLPSLAPVAGTPALADVEALVEKPWIDNVLEWQGDDLHPKQNLVNYGGGMARDNGVAALSLLLDYTEAEKRTLLLRMVQLGIDDYGLVQHGAFWGNVGGTIGVGRKMPILFAGLMLGNEDMLNVAQDYNTRLTFLEDGQTFYLTPAESAATYNPENCSGSADYCHPGYYDSLANGTPCWGERHYKWESTSYAYLPGKLGYLGITHKSTVGTALTAKILGLDDDWNHPAYFDWMDRCVAEGVTGTWGSLFADFMWRTYHDYQTGFRAADYGPARPALPAVPNPMTVKAAGDWRSGITGLRLFNTLGGMVPAGQDLHPGMYAAEYHGFITKLIVME